MTNKQLFFVPHQAIRHVVNNIMIGHVVTDDPETKLSFPIPPLGEHSILFFPHDRPVIEDVNTKYVYTM